MGIKHEELIVPKRQSRLELGLTFELGLGLEKLSDCLYTLSLTLQGKAPRELILLYIS